MLLVCGGHLSIRSRDKSMELGGYEDSLRGFCSQGTLIVCENIFHLSQCERGLQLVSRGQELAKQPITYRIADTTKGGVALNV